MKKIILSLLFLTIAMVSFCQVPEATQIPQSFIDIISNFIEKHIWITYVLTGLFALEQFLAQTTWFKANSTCQLIAGWLNWVYKLFGKK